MGRQGQVLVAPPWRNQIRNMAQYELLFDVYFRLHALLRRVRIEDLRARHCYASLRCRQRRSF